MAKKITKEEVAALKKEANAASLYAEEAQQAADEQDFYVEVLEDVLYSLNVPPPTFKDGKVFLKYLKMDFKERVADYKPEAQRLQKHANKADAVAEKLQLKFRDAEGALRYQREEAVAARRAARSPETAKPQ